MDVHYPHHSTHKKKWTEYLMEFVMLFLAVFLGFVAENIREATVEKRKEKEFIGSLIQDLKDDTGRLNNNYIPFLQRNVEMMDSLFRLSNQNLAEPQNRIALARLYLFYGIRFGHFKSNNETLSQLKSGSYRLIQRRHIADSIARYDYFDTQSEQQADVTMTRHNELLSSSLAVFNSYSLLATSDLKNVAFAPVTRPPVITRNHEKLQLFFNNVVTVEISTAAYLALLKIQLQYAIHLLDLLQKEYNLNDG